jgi:hypothetical protein
MPKEEAINSLRQTKTSAELATVKIILIAQVLFTQIEKEVA